MSASLRPRRPDWPDRLTACLARWQDMPFAWGRADCVHFVDAVAVAVTGARCFEDLPPYGTEAGARRALVARGLRGVGQYAAAHLDGIPRALARRGDVVLGPAPGAAPGALGIVAGTEALFVQARGLVSVPLVLCPRSWRLGA